MKNLKSAIILMGMFSMLLQTQVEAQSPKNFVPVNTFASEIKSGEFRQEMTEVFQENILWTRNLMLCIIDSLPGKDQAMWRLVKNQEDLSLLFKNYFGADASAALTELFYSHLNFQVEVINASVTDSVLAKEALQRWHKSANAIAEYLYKLNSKWLLKDMKEILNTQVDLTYQAIRQRVMRDYDLDVIAFDKMFAISSKVSNMLSQGIIYQYPQKFSDLATKSSALK